jgi:hypothetical protein
MVNFNINEEIDNNDGTFSMLVKGIINVPTTNAWSNNTNLNVNLPNITSLIRTFGYWNYNSSYGININTFYKTNASSEQGECLKITQNGNRIGARIISRNTGNKDYQVVATYTKPQFSVNITGNPSDKVSDITGGGDYYTGQQVNINATIESGYEVDKVEDNGVEVSNTLPYSFSMDDSDHDIVITAKEIV